MIIEMIYLYIQCPSYTVEYLHQHLQFVGSSSEDGSDREFDPKIR